ncbi:amidophosphoribosyltransferase [Candidatus Kaiserbacteria bacterium RIFCSPHIGHO2_12_FULL_53_13]|uniref:Amidophosphoribosyltransferase n=1 Tax=Candidatus Kaiserbacteria bacterium RIFCSPHIGHO2_12_FULL_53_13 TaxID=1798502 RepID=A0A1F6EC55_9BACT|nr:MAG: amidophosphoribosyltransferase [Candidatus Kaiserbacteria bacterium RIFCSPHIGHO2_12_FULL_53_13]OGG74301.1 MAG: amidophosphoribosyltransferase [Candidatus Kaiserbacteria bacterium RIFCSPLOWO2_01_FULL_52_36]
MSDLGEKCGVFGVFGRGLDVSRITFFGLFALQHRGQESSGIATSDGGERIACHKGMGLVSQVFSEEVMQKLTGHIAIGHNRYSTAGGSHVDHAQPTIVGNWSIALAHNGNLPSTVALEEFLHGKQIETEKLSDSRMIAEAIGVLVKEGASLEEAIKKAYPLMTGAFSILIMSKDKLIAVRDECGIRPLSIATLNGGFVFSSETCAFQTVGADFIRDVNPGEMVVIDENGLHSEQLVAPNPKMDIFEFVYFARPDSHLLGKSVYSVRRNFGVQLAKEYPLRADVIIPVPETAIPVAIGYANESGIPLEMGLTKNRYIHRTFIEPEQHIRDQGVKAKLTPIAEVIKGKRVAVIDDSIVRGTTSRKIVEMLFGAGASEVHFLVSSPPIMFPDFYGIDTPKQKNLLASEKSIPEMKEYLGATSLQFLSYQGMIKATGIPEDQFSTSCFTGEYPIDIKERMKEIVAKKVCYTPFSNEHHA